MLTLLFTILLTLTQSGKDARRLLGKNQSFRRLLGKNDQRRLSGKNDGYPRRLLGKNIPVVQRRLLGKNFAIEKRRLLRKRQLLQNPAVPLPTATEATGATGATEMECLLSNKDPAGCAGRVTNIMNPPQNFKLKCGAIGSCASSTFNFGYTNMVERIEMILMAAPWSGYGATIIIDSRGALGVGQSIDVLECAEIGACQDLVIKLYGSATINDIKCSQLDFCQGCTIKECHDNPAGIEVCVPTPCWGY